MLPKPPNPSHSNTLPQSLCTHLHLRTTPHPSQSHFHRLSPSRRAAAAATVSKTHKPAIADTVLGGFLSDAEFASAFPGPLVLVGDDLALDPKQRGQSCRAWVRAGERNVVEEVKGMGGERGEGGRGGKGKGGKGGEREEMTRRTIYVVGPPGIDGEGVEEFMKGWNEYEIAGGETGEEGTHSRKGVKWELSDWVADVISYLQAFYHGIPVKLLDSPKLHFTPWRDPDPDPDPDISTNPSRSNPKSQSQSTRRRRPIETYISLGAPTSKTRVRTRRAPTPCSLFPHQVNLSDILDRAIDILPPDACALLLLVQHDLYEDPDDEFICGRAHGGSRVAVVSTVRYHPGLDGVQGVERSHVWPGSHCAGYGDGVCGMKGRGKKRKIDNDNEEEGYAIDGSPLSRAVAAQNNHQFSPSPSPSIKSQQSLYLSRICRTASHELGHCFGIDHCIYYACNMQGSASIQEDARQPPYLCPVDLAKLVLATGADVRERYEGLLGVCERFGGRGEGGDMFAAFGEWIRGRVEGMDGRGRGGEEGVRMNDEEIDE